VRVRAKTRTRQHIIADMSFNHFEGFVLECGHVAEPLLHDYGYDAFVFTYDERGELEPGQILVQLKATDHLNVLKDGRTISFPLDRRDLKVWLRELLPVIFVVYDAQKKRAYWLHVQQYLASMPTSELFAKAGQIRVCIPMSNRVNRHALRLFAQYRNERLSRPWERSS
jgi:hypothetical protein